MSTTVDRLLAQRERLDAQIKRALERPEEPDREDATVIWFQVQFPSSRRVYTYAAIRIGPYWYLTGSTQSRSKYTWDELLDWLEENNASATEMWVATQWEEVL